MNVSGWQNPTNGHRNEALRDLSTLTSLVGTELSSADWIALEGRWVNRELAEAASLRRVDSFIGAQLVGRKAGDYAGIAIPYFLPGSPYVREYRLRRDHPDFELSSDGRTKPKQKYLSPPGRSNMLYFAPGTSETQLRNADLPVIITEGEFKTLALSRLANWPARSLPVSFQ